jgi:hypothetical protein
MVALRNRLGQSKTTTRSTSPVATLGNPERLITNGEYPSHFASRPDAGRWKFRQEINRTEMSEAEPLGNRSAGKVSFITMDKHRPKPMCSLDSAHNTNISVAVNDYRAGAGTTTVPQDSQRNASALWLNRPRVIRIPPRSPVRPRRRLNLTPGDRPTITPSVISLEHTGQIMS